MEETYSIYEVADILSIPNGRIREWVSRGFIKPYSKSKGRGTKHRLDLVNIYGIGLFDYFLERGIAREVAGISVEKFSVAFRKIRSANATLKLIETAIQEFNQSAPREDYEDPKKFVEIMCKKIQRTFGITGGALAKIDGPVDKLETLENYLNKCIDIKRPQKIHLMTAKKDEIYTGKLFLDTDKIEVSTDNFDEVSIIDVKKIIDQVDNALILRK